MRRKQKITYSERVQENIRLIKADQKLLDQIDERIEQRHHNRIKQIPS
ncbi:FbpB family small basic protein [Halobacillus shinanisalinarum]|uniref:FbpB family small basic protein n=1 Tax=Halobacillus shinanisalinarum TaxID=2932258 RepID=A0ABY4H389_9BACI|nr:FbpB family small basic protein [Halobacillus shinanisalinarum]UOQ93442.1 FbpB family small basic protein [Halobacillus shinanisalinarum]